MSKDPRTAAERRDLCRQYHAARKAGQPPPGPMAVKPRVLAFQSGQHNRQAWPYSRLSMKEDRAKITLPGGPVANPAEPGKPKCYGDLRREAFKRAGLVGYRGAGPLTIQPTDETADDEEIEDEQPVI